MTWLKLDDGFPEHPKVAAAGDEAGWLFVCALAYASRNLTDGFIPQAAVGRLTGLKRPAAAMAALVDVGLVELADGGYRIAGYLKHQRTREQVRKDREDARERQRKAREAAAARAAEEASNSDVTDMSQRDNADCHTEVHLQESESESKPDAKVLSIGTSFSSRSSDPFENDARWRRLADAMESRSEPRHNTFRTIRRLLDEGIADHLIDAASGQTIAKEGMGLGYFTTIARDWYSQRVSS